MSNNQLSVFPLTKGQKKDLAEKVKVVNQVNDTNEGFKSFSYKAIRGFNNYARSCNGEYVILCVRKDLSNLSLEQVGDCNKQITYSIPQPGVTKEFDAWCQRAMQPWVTKAQLFGVTLSVSRDDMSEIYYSAILQRVLKSGFKRVSWNELPDEFAHEYDQYQVRYLYFKYGVLCYGYGLLRINTQTLCYAYSSPEMNLPFGGRILDRDLIMGQDLNDSECAATRHDMGVEISRSLEFWKGDPDQTLNITQEISNDGDRNQDTGYDRLQ